MLDLAGLGVLVAQAMGLRTARELHARGRRLVLVAPSARLRVDSARLNVFGIVESLQMPVIGGR